jgi:hypothetical protein
MISVNCCGAFLAGIGSHVWTVEEIEALNDCEQLVNSADNFNVAPQRAV